MVTKKHSKTLGKPAAQAADIPVDAEHADQYRDALTHNVDDAFTISSAFEAVELIADSMCRDDEFHGLSISLLLHAIAKAGTEAANRQNMLTNPDAYRVEVAEVAHG